MHTESLRIAVINPNSNPVYTEHISRSADSLRHSGVTIDCLTLQEGPLAIETDEDISSVIDPVCGLVKQLESTVSGFVIACFADPGLHEARQVTARPVIGCCEAAVMAASGYGSRLGLISTGDDINGDRDLILSYKKDIETLAIVCPEIPTADLPTDPSAEQKMIECAKDLQEQRMNAIIFGCAGMASYASRVRSNIEVAVVEPVSTGVKLLLRVLSKDASANDAKNQSTAIA